MKISLSILLLLIPMVAAAQNLQGMNNEQMQKIMQQMQEMQACMQKVDKDKLKALEKRSKQFEAEVKSLCTNGKRDKAQKKAISFGKEIAKDPSMQAMRKCGELSKGTMQNMPFMDQETDYSKRHVCD